MTEVPDVLGWMEGEAVDLLKREGFEVDLIRYSSRKGVPGADCSRVIRQRQNGARAELTVSEFKCCLDLEGSYDS